MTTPDAEPAVKQYRALFAWALLAYVAISLFFSLLTWLVPSDGSTIFGRSWWANNDVTSLVTIALPLLAVLITGVVRPVVSAAKLFAFIALAEYAFIVLFGLLTFLLGLVAAFDGIHDARSSFGVFSGVLLALIRLVLAALAAWVTFNAFTSLGGKLSMPATPPPPPPVA
jgi:hypothetical protein